MELSTDLPCGLSAVREHIALPMNVSVEADTAYIAEKKLKIRPNCAARTVENDIRPIVEISQRSGIAIEAATFLGSSPIRRP